MVASHGTKQALRQVKVYKVNIKFTGNCID
jgi:hypothetical protein